MSLLERISIVLVEPQEALNVGSALRAAWNMGIHDLRLVEPCPCDPQRFGITAPGLKQVALELPRYPSTREALADGIVAVGFTSRPRRGRYRVWELEQFAQDLPTFLAPPQGRCHLVFGREDFGLSNEDLGLCHGYVVISTDRAYRSLNLAQAVLLACYAIRRWVGATEPSQPSPSEHPPARIEDLDGLMDQARRTLEFIEFFKTPGADVSLLRTLRAIFSRAALDQREVRIFRGIFSEVTAFCHRRGIEPSSDVPSDQRD